MLQTHASMAADPVPDTFPSTERLRREFHNQMLTLAFKYQIALLSPGLQLRIYSTALQYFLWEEI